MPQLLPIVEMKDRIRQIMESQHMTQQVFAQFIEMSPASLSSIFNGRTKPTINIVEAIKKKIPDISIDWLMFGTGSMYSQAVSVPHSAPEKKEASASVVVDSPRDPVLNFEYASAPANETTPQQSPYINSVKNTRQILSREEVKIIDKPPRRVTEIRIYYDDQTWESFTPSKK